MLEYAAKLTLEPWNMKETDVAALRETGFSDEAILDINQVVGYYAFVNRLADGLGVQLEEFGRRRRMPLSKQINCRRFVKRYYRRNIPVIQNAKSEISHSKSKKTTSC